MINVYAVAGPTFAKPGDLIAVTGTGFDPNEAVTIELQSEPVRIATTTADASGAFTVSATIPTATHAGDHSIVAVAASGTATSPITVNAVPIETAPVVTSAPDSTPVLASTGADGLSWQLTLAVLFLLTGGTLLVTRRRA